MNTQAVATAVAGIDGVASVSQWTRVAGRERVYFGLTRYNGITRELVAGQIGGEGWVDATGAVFLKPGGHNATVSHAREAGTVAAIIAAARAALAGTQQAPALLPEEEAEKEDHIR